MPALGPGPGVVGNLVGGKAGGADFSAQALTAPSGFAGRDGIFRFLPDGVAERGLAVLKVLPRGFEVIGEAPETFQPVTE